PHPDPHTLPTRRSSDLQRSSNRYYQRPDARSFHYDPARTALAGVSADLYLNRVAGNWRWGVAGRTTSPGFEVNDLGFQNRVDRIDRKSTRLNSSHGSIS